MAEDQSRHRQYLEKRVINSDIYKSYAGMICGLVVAVYALFVAKEIALNGHPAVAAIIASFDIAALVGIFVIGSNLRKQERSKRSKSDFQ